MATKAKRHTHKYHQINVAGTMVWACSLGDCNHYMPNHLKRMVPGKNSMCWKCDGDMKMDDIAMETINPICIPCRTGITTNNDFENMTDAMRARINSNQ